MKVILQIAANSGDVRSAINICERSFEIARVDALRHEDSLNMIEDKENKMLSPLPGSRIHQLTKSVTPTVSHMAQAIRSSQSGSITINLETALPVHQKLALCTLLLMRKQKQLKEVL